MTAVHQTISTPDGPFTVVANEAGGVVASGWAASALEVLSRVRVRDRPERALAGTVAATAAVAAYYAGDVRAIDDVQVELHGTEGQLAGWRALRGIEPGRPLTYTELARAMNNPRAVRAAASVCARNAVALFVPCHRVLRADGSLGGFAWGEQVKRSLLEREAREVSAD